MKNRMLNPYKEEYSKLVGNITKNIKNLKPEIVKQAKELNLDLFPISALNVINSSEDAEIFKGIIYPLEIGKRYFDESDESIYSSRLDEVVATENCELLGDITWTPRKIAKREINIGYQLHLISSNFKGLEKINEIWDLYKEVNSHFLKN